MWLTHIQSSHFYFQNKTKLFIYNWIHFTISFAFATHSVIQNQIEYQIYFNLSSDFDILICFVLASNTPVNDQ